MDSYSKLFKKLTDQNINVLFAGVVLIKKIRAWNRKNIKNYLEIYLKSNTKKIIKKNIKAFIKKQIILLELKLKQNSFKPDIIIHNNFDKKINILSKNLIRKN